MAHLFLRSFEISISRSIPRFIFLLSFRIFEIKYPIEVVVGPEYITGSSRMKAGTAQKLVLNMISSTVMIKLGRIKGNKMVDMQLSNNKLVKRGHHIIKSELNISEAEAIKLLNESKSVRIAINNYKKNKIEKK